MLSANEITQLLADFHIIEKEALDEALSFVQTKTLEKKELLLKEGQVCKNLYYVKTGLLKNYCNVNDQEVVTWFTQENNFITSVESFFTQRPSTENVIALEPCTLYYFSFDHLMHLAKKYHSCALFGLSLTMHHYSGSETRRLFNMRHKDANTRYKHLLDTQPEIFLRCPLKDIASFLSITVETLSRLRAKNMQPQS